MQNGSHFLDQPIFISGYHKSGTTLLLSIFDGHPDLVVIPEELNFFKSVLFSKDKARAIREQTGFKMFLSAENMPEWSHWRTFYREGYPEFDQEEFRRQFDRQLAISRSFKQLLLGMVRAFAEVDQVDPTGKKHWVSKTPQEEMYLPLMRQMFGMGYRLIYIVRDPRDVFLSVSKWKTNQGRETQHNLQEKLVQFAVQWQTRVNRALAYQKQYPTVCVFRYEDLLLSPEKTLARLCEFVNIAYDPVLLQPTRHGKQWGGNSVYSEGFQGLSDEPLGRYKSLLDPAARYILEQLLYKELDKFGYLETGEPFNASVQPARVPWGDFQRARTKYTMRYQLNQLYQQLRFQIPALH